MRHIRCLAYALASIHLLQSERRKLRRLGWTCRYRFAAYRATKRHGASLLLFHFEAGLDLLWPGLRSNTPVLPGPGVGLSCDVVFYDSRCAKTFRCVHGTCL